MAPPFPSATPTWHSKTYPTLSPTRPELSAKGKAIVITGGGTGIGAETARSFAAAGASRIALFGRREQPLHDTRASIEQQYPGVEVFVASVDVLNKGQVDAAFDKFAGTGKIHVLVCNAAMGGPFESITDVDIDEFMDGIDQNLRAAMYVSRAYLRHAVSDGVIIDVNSGAALISMIPGFASYSCAKLVQFKAFDMIASLYPQLSVYHTQPGVVDTDMNRKAGGVARLGYEDHVSLPADYNVWLASPEAKFLRNKYLYTNWDVDELKAHAKELEAGPKLSVGLVGWPFPQGDWMIKP